MNYSRKVACPVGEGCRHVSWRSKRAGHFLISDNHNAKRGRYRQPLSKTSYARLRGYVSACLSPLIACSAIVGP
ncbi:hypothetical protein L484_016531 [Morus notabilis]|uniref:Uncharacterized protein n=1 Tax=Morus notabilis TaxID=981085 RepID=W9R6F6_9ROSA|nr:hypothetical protein L484_016531 [Morus notabilis]